MSIQRLDKEGQFGRRTSLKDVGKLPGKPYSFHISQSCKLTLTVPEHHNSTNSFISSSMSNLNGDRSIAPETIQILKHKDNINSSNPLEKQYQQEK